MNAAPQRQVVSHTPPRDAVPAPDLCSAYTRVRECSERLVAPLSAEDAVVQSMPLASPAKWHLAHTTWFFETLVLEPCAPGFKPFRPEFKILFNSYYNSIGEQHPRPARGMLTRPTLEQVREYRRHVDDRMERLLQGGGLPEEMLRVVEIGLHHEQQHQELILMDVKHLLSRNPLWPAYKRGEPRAAAPAGAPLRWMAREGGPHAIGWGGDGFSYDNERPRHRVVIEPFEIASRPVTNKEFLAFIEDGGYQRADLWLSDGWDAVRRESWQAPLYWRRRDGAWTQFTLSGEVEPCPEEPACHVSYYEADAYARWAGARLPTEMEWEHVAAPLPLEGNFVETGLLHPAPVGPASGSDPQKMFGDVWEWTRSAYAPYPGYSPPAGTLGEYNGKFMCNQMVLRGGACVTPASHLRPTYRNFFYPDNRWQFGGIRLARDPR
ncbi:MAG: ergothioneine biosynthesis protein EgtB [Acidobacteriota bacterium]